MSDRHVTHYAEALELTPEGADMLRRDLQGFVAKVEAALAAGTLRSMVLGLAVHTPEDDNAADPDVETARLDVVRHGFDEATFALLTELNESFVEHMGGHHEH